MSWDGFIDKLLSAACVKDAVIVGLVSKTVWAYHADGVLRHVTPAEVAALLVDDKSNMLIHGVTLAGRKYSVLRASLEDDCEHTMDLRSKADVKDAITYNVTIGKSKQTLVIAEGKEGVHAGNLNKEVFEMVTYLRKQEY